MQSNPLRRLLLFKNTVAFFGDFRNWNCDADFVRSLPELVLKTNEYLQLGAITGCLRISKESIFTGLKHLNAVFVLDKKFSEHFRFTETEARQMMAHYGVENRFSTRKEWRDRYAFGEALGITV